MLSARGRGLAATNGCAVRIFVILFVLIFDDVEFVAQMMALTNGGEDGSHRAHRAPLLADHLAHIVRRHTHLEHCRVVAFVTLDGFHGYFLRVVDQGAGDLRHQLFSGVQLFVVGHAAPAWAKERLCILRGGAGCSYVRLSSGRRSRSFLVILEQLSDAIRELSAIAGPVIDAILLQEHAGGASPRIIGSYHFNGPAVAGAVLFNHDHTVVRLLTRSKARQTDHQHRISVPFSKLIKNRLGIVQRPAGGTPAATVRMCMYRTTPNPPSMAESAGFRKVRLWRLGYWRRLAIFSWGRQKDADSVTAIERALDLGINWIDRKRI